MVEWRKMSTTWTNTGATRSGRGSGAGTTFQQGGQDQPFPAGGLGHCKASAGSGAEPRRQADFDNNLLKIN